MRTTPATLGAIALALAAGATLAANSLQPDRPGARPHARERLLERFDADADGALGHDERRVARQTFRDRLRDRATARFDADADGELSDSERQAARAHARERLAHRRGRVLNRIQDRGMAGLPPHLADALAPFDLNENLMLDDDERAPLESEIDARLETRRAEIIARFDTDADGELGQSERDAARETRRAEHEARRAELLTRHDANADGPLDRAERAALRDAQGPRPRDPLLELLRPRHAPGAERRRHRGPGGLRDQPRGDLEDAPAPRRPHAPRRDI